MALSLMLLLLYSVTKALMIQPERNEQLLSSGSRRVDPGRTAPAAGHWSFTRGRIAVSASSP
jgi:hypothetical protein